MDIRRTFLQTNPRTRAGVNSRQFFHRRRTTHDRDPGNCRTSCPAPAVRVVRASRAARSNAVSPDPAGPDRVGVPVWVRVRSVGPVVAAGEVADGLGEQPAEELDLFLLPGAAGTEVRPEDRAWYST